MRKSVMAALSAVSLLIIVPRHGHGQVFESDSLALVTLYDSTDGQNWVNAPTWLNGPVADWEGVRTSGGRVTQLRLFGFNLSGILPRAIADLDSLDLLWVSDNNLEGGFPEFLIGMPRLSSIDLTLNQFTGPIPPELGQMTQLTRLALNRNQFTGTLPGELASLANLTSLHVGDNLLSGEIPAGIWELTNLVHLQLHMNEFTGSIPENVGDLTKLQSLLLNNTSLSGPIPESIGNLTELGSLWLGGGALSGSIPSSIGNLTELFQLTIEMSELSGPIPPEIGNLRNLVRLTLWMNQLSGPIPPEMGNLESATLIRIGFNNLSGEIPDNLGNLASIVELRVRGNPDLTGPLPWSFTNNTTLEFLDISGTDICIIDNPAYHTWLDSVDVVVPRPAQACAPGVSTETSVAPGEFALVSSYPNPASETQNLTFVLPSSDHVRITLFDGLGRRAKVISDRIFGPGRKTVSWNATDLAPGVYRLDVAGSSERLSKLVVVSR